MSYYNIDTRSSYRDHFVDPPTPLQRLSRSLLSMFSRNSPAASHSKRTAKWNWKWLLALPNVLIFVWAYALLWGERWSFTKSIQACAWENWENWVCVLQKHFFPS